MRIKQETYRYEWTCCAGVCWKEANHLVRKSKELIDINEICVLGLVWKKPVICSVYSILPQLAQTTMLWNSEIPYNMDNFSCNPFNLIQHRQIFHFSHASTLQVLDWQELQQLISRENPSELCVHTSPHVMRPRHHLMEWGQTEQNRDCKTVTGLLCKKTKSYSVPILQIKESAY